MRLNVQKKMMRKRMKGKKRVKRKEKVKRAREREREEQVFMLRQVMSSVLFIQTSLYLYSCTERHVLKLTNMTNLCLVLLSSCFRNMRMNVPSGLPPIRGIKHQIEFVPGVTIPNRLAYRSNPEETKELQRQVEELLTK